MVARMARSTTLRRLLAACALLVLLAGMARAGAAFWVWNRTEPLTANERQELAAAGVDALYWHCAEIENKNGQWEWKRPPKWPQKSEAGLRVVPVIRLEASVERPFAEDSSKVLSTKLAAAFRSTGADEWQLDYDAPDRLVGDYAAFLTALRPQAPKLSSTALAGWVRLPSFPALQASVAELLPMFYDLEPDSASSLRPLVEPEATRARLAEWTKSCRIPWRAGLPWFARLSVYGADGKSRGHFREWGWDDIVFRRELVAHGPVRGGMVALRCERPTPIEGRKVDKSESVVARRVDLTSLQAVEKDVGRDVVFFRLPDEAASSGWSLRQFAARARAADPPVLALRLIDNHLVLSNTGTSDLPLRIDGNTLAERGYALELEAPTPVFREAQPGAFAALEGLTRPESDQVQTVPVAGATRLLLRFAALSAGREIRSGFLQFAPGVASSSLRWRISPTQPPPTWNPFALPP